MIRLKCPGCSAALGVDEGEVGRSAFCPACGLIFTVPAPAMLLDGGEGDGGEGDGGEGDGGERGGASASASKTPEPADPLLPEGPIDLAPDTPPPSQRDLDPWMRADPRPREIKIAEQKREPIPLADVVARQSERTRKASQPTAASSSTIVANKEGEVADWSFLTLEPMGEAVDVPLQPIMRPVAAHEDAAPATPADVPLAELMEAELAEAIPVLEPEAEILEALPVALPSPPLAAPPAQAEQLEWSETPRIDVGLPRWMKKPKSTGTGLVSLIPGLDDFILAVIALSTLWLILLIWVVLAPKVFWVPLIVGGLVWICGNFWFGLAFEDIGNIGRAAITILPLPAYPLFIVYGVVPALVYDLCALLFMGAIAIPYIIRSPEWTLRPLGIASLGAGIVFTALFVAAANQPSPLPSLDLDDRVPAVIAPQFDDPPLPPAPPDPNDPP